MGRASRARAKWAKRAVRYRREQLRATLSDLGRRLRRLFGQHRKFQRAVHAQEHARTR